MKIHQTRVDMINDIIIENSICAELGVLLGEFSSEFLKCSPRKLFLVDIWPEDKIISGDQNGNNLKEYISGIQLYDYVRSKFMVNPNVEIVKSNSQEFLLKSPNNYFDFVYIDTSHNFDDSLNELEISLQKTKKGGFICGHDYAVNAAKCKNIELCNSFGVREAVNLFCSKYNLKITHLALDGCISFGILNE